MWEDLDKKQREYYKKLILGFASLTEIFSQKANDEDMENKAITPFINSKYQESVFQKSFNAQAEDVGNTAYDASLKIKTKNGEDKRYLIGIKTFQDASEFQKIFQMKDPLQSCSEIINQIEINGKHAIAEIDSNARNYPSLAKKSVNKANKKLYKELATKIAVLRNESIEFATKNLRGMSINPNMCVNSVYHVLKTSKIDEPHIQVCEFSYDFIDVQNLKIKGCTKYDKPKNFEFTDGKHDYKYTDADKQLYMKFNRQNSAIEEWKVVYEDNPDNIFLALGEKNLGKIREVDESYSWLITYKNGNVKKFSGFNSFYGVGSKEGYKKVQKSAGKKLKAIHNKYAETVDNKRQLSRLINLSNQYFDIIPKTDSDREKKAELRNQIMDKLNKFDNQNLKSELKDLLYQRPAYEMYIPINKAKEFHKAHPYFFCKKPIRTNEKKQLIDPIEDRTFKLVLEPSGDEVDVFICQEEGKGIESVNTQTDLGKWILGNLFDLKEYEPVTREILENRNINGYRLTKYKGDDKVHFEFIKIDIQNPPLDFVK